MEKIITLCSTGLVGKSEKEKFKKLKATLKKFKLNFSVEYKQKEKS